MPRIISYNIRYNNPADGDNAWPHRKDKVASLLQLYQPDLIGLQEVLHDQLTYLFDALPDYDWIGVGRDDGQTQGEYAPIFYRRDRFGLFNHGTFWLSETPNVAGSFGWDAACVRLATWASLVDRTTKKQWLHLNTHFDHRGRLAQANSAKMVRQFLTDHNNSGSIVISGDFNCVVGSEPYQLLLKPDKPNGFSLSDTMQHSQTPHHGPSGTLNTNFVNPIRDKIDFIFVGSMAPETTNGAVIVARHAVLADHWDGRYPSDHLPVLVDLA